MKLIYERQWQCEELYHVDQIWYELRTITKHIDTFSLYISIQTSNVPAAGVINYLQWTLSIEFEELHLQDHEFAFLVGI